MRSTPLLRLHNIAKRFGSAVILHEVTLEVSRAERFALLGPSGCGKSTLLRLIAGLDAPTGGEVWIDGGQASLSEKVIVPPHERAVAMVFQDLALWPSLTVRGNVELGLVAKALGREQRSQCAQAALDLCRIGELGERYPSELSGGQQQRVALARALAVRPQLLLLDEPFSGLDLATKAHLYAAIRQLCADLALTLVMVTHDPLEAAALCAHAAVLERGRVVESGGFDALLREPTSETLRTFVAQLPR